MGDFLFVLSEQYLGDIASGIEARLSWIVSEAKQSSQLGY
jgi:hypothetical protein